MLGFIIVLCGVSMLMAAHNLKRQGSVKTAGRLRLSGWIALAVGLGLSAAGMILSWYAAGARGPS